MNIVFLPKRLKGNLKNLNPSEKGEYCIFAKLIKVNLEREKNSNPFENSNTVVLQNGKTLDY